MTRYFVTRQLIMRASGLIVCPLQVIRILMIQSRETPAEGEAGVEGGGCVPPGCGATVLGAALFEVW